MRLLPRADQCVPDIEHPAVNRQGQNVFVAAN